MSDMRELLIQNASRLFRDTCTASAFEQSERGDLPAQVWTPLVESGIPDAARAAGRGGSGTDLGDALALVREAGAHCVPAPIAETMLAELSLAAAGLPPRSGIGTVGGVVPADILEARQVGNEWLLSGTLHRVPWARHCDFIVLQTEVAGKALTLVTPRPAIIGAAHNFAHEPRDTVTFENHAVPAESVSMADTCLGPDGLRFLGALFRTAAMTGAMSRLIDMAVTYAQERRQFGRAIGQFQAVQHLLAIMASQVAAANAANDSVPVPTVADLPRFDIGAAKTRVSEAAGIAAGIAHQVHGAIGFSHEYQLHRYTRRLWSWRDEFGSEFEWASWLGEVTARLGADGLWPFLTSESRTTPREQR
jgi:acyl-CoA dehydrogenase